MPSVKAIATMSYLLDPFGNWRRSAYGCKHVLHGMYLLIAQVGKNLAHDVVRVRVFAVTLKIRRALS